MRHYGNVRLDSKRGWIIMAEPHICLRMKRVFAKVEKTVGNIILSNTPENCRDLLWFIDRYPLAIGANYLRALRRGAKEHRDHVLCLEEILSGKYQNHTFELAIPAREYQKQAAALWLKNKFLVLGDDVGVGKTGSAICGLTDPDTRPALVCTLAHLPRQWQGELTKFAPNLSTHILKSGIPYELPKINGNKPDVLICNYHKIDGWAHTLAGEMRSVIFDEVQELRRSDSNRYRGAVAVARKAKYALGLSATPVYNNGGEMFNVASALKADILGSKEEFTREWCTGTKGAVKEPKAFGSFLRENGIMLRRTRADVKRELPAITHVLHTVESDIDVLDDIKSAAAQLARIILSDSKKDRGDSFTAAGKFDVLMRQATGIAKAPYVAEFVKLLLETGERVVLFGWHRAVYDIWAEKLAEYEPVFYTGEETGPQKEAAKQAFVEGKTPLMIISLRSGAGVDGLQHVCRTCVVGESDWSPGVLEQCCGRIYRDGQKDPVTAYYLMSDEGSDPIMTDILGLKKQQIDGINNPDQDIIERVANTSDHVRKLAQQYMDKINSAMLDELAIEEEVSGPCGIAS